MQSSTEEKKPETGEATKICIAVVTSSSEDWISSAKDARGILVPQLSVTVDVAVIGSPMVLPLSTGRSVQQWCRPNCALAGVEELGVGRVGKRM